VSSHLKKRHLLVVNGSRDLPDLACQAEPGLRLTIITRVSMLDRVWDPDKYERIVALPRRASESEWLVTAQLVHSTDPFDAIVNFTENDQLATATIGEALGLKTYRRDTALAVNDKNLMRQRLRDAGVDDTPSARVHTQDELDAAANRFGYPLICKPVSGVGSQGVTKLTRPADTEHAFSWARDAARSSSSEALIVERYYAGAEYSVECVSEGSRHVVVGITEKHTDPASYMELGHVVPAPIDDATTSRIVDTVVRALDALGVTDQATHTEVIVTDDAVRIVETHLRCGGGGIVAMLKEIKGVDMPVAPARQSLGLSVIDEVADAVRHYAESGTRRSAASWHATLPSHGTVRRVRGEADAWGGEGIYDVKILRKPGTRVEGLTGNYSRGAIVWAVGENAEQALARARSSASMLTFEMSDVGPHGQGSDKVSDSATDYVTTEATAANSADGTLAAPVRP